MDAALQVGAHDIPKLLAKMDEFDTVVGYRIKLLDTIFKKLSAKIANNIHNKLSNESTRDIGCPLKVMKRECIQNIKLFKGMHRIPYFSGREIGNDIAQYREQGNAASQFQLRRGILNLYAKTFISEMTKNDLPAFIDGTPKLLILKAGEYDKQSNLLSGTELLSRYEIANEKYVIVGKKCWRILIFGWCWDSLPRAYSVSVAMGGL